VIGHFNGLLIETIGFIGLEIETFLEILIFSLEVLELTLEFLLVSDCEFVELLHLFVGISQSATVLLKNFSFSLVSCVVGMLEFLVQFANLLVHFHFPLLQLLNCPLQFVQLLPLRLFGQNLSQFGQVSTAHQQVAS
jgi:hypothetical protein